MGLVDIRLICTANYIKIMCQRGDSAEAGLSKPTF